MNFAFLSSPSRETFKLPEQLFWRIYLEITYMIAIFGFRISFSCCIRLIIWDSWRQRSYFQELLVLVIEFWVFVRSKSDVWSFFYALYDWFTIVSFVFQIFAIYIEPQIHHVVRIFQFLSDKTSKWTTNFWGLRAMVISVTAKPDLKYPGRIKYCNRKLERKL